MSTLLYRHYRNDKNLREYKVVVVRDLLGDLNLVRYFGSHRIIEVVQDEQIPDAIAMIDKERRQHGYHCALEFATV